MQRRSILDSFPEPVDLNQGSLSSNTSMDQPNSWDDLLDPVEGRFPNSMVAVGDNGSWAPSFRRWDRGESSSGANSNNRIGRGWSSSSSSHALANQPDPRLEERRFELPNNFVHERSNSHYGVNDQIVRPSLLPFSPNHSDGATELMPGATNNSDHFMGDNEASDSSLGMWDLFCKEKGLEGKPGQSYGGGSSSSNPRADDVVRHNVPACYAPSSSNISSSSNTGFLGQVNSRNGLCTRVEDVEMLPPLGIRENSWIQQSASVGHSHVSSGHVPPRPFSTSSNWESRYHLSPPVDSRSHSNQSQSMYAPSFSRGTHSVSWSDSQDAQAGSSSSLDMLCGERSVGLQGEPSFRSPLRNSGERQSFNSANETRNSVQDGPNWNTPTMGSSQDIPSNSGIGAGSSQRTYPTRRVVNWNHRRLSDGSPWTRFTPAEYESASQRGHLSQLPSASMSPEETVLSSLSSSISSGRANHRPYLQSNVMAEEASADNRRSWHALATADIEGRHRMVSEIRQMLNAMQRIENFWAEEYTMLDPFINGAAELHDRHRDMRLDVDNMSYEELLALEERIGNVSTGLSEETILGSMKQHKYKCVYGGKLPSKVEPCCICQEEYVAGDDVGTLQCEHQFHTDCIKQWLTQKNLCPICKTSALDI